MTRRKTRKAPPPSGEVIHQQVLSRYQNLLSPDQFKALINELSNPLPQAIRVNTLKSSPGEALSDWSARYHWETKAIPFCQTGCQILSASEPISQTIEHRLGYYYIQDAASMLPVELFNLDGHKEPLILDMAASPGGKTTHIINRTGDKGLIIANDASISRLPALHRVLNNWGAVNTAITCFQGEKFGAWFPESFDRVLLDAPCSMENLRSSASHPMRSITYRERQGLVQRQVRLLTSALQAVRIGGEVVYSTCTLAPEEDEAVLDQLVRTFPGAFTIANLTTRFPEFTAHALPEDETRQFDPSVTQALRLWPHIMGTSGFFSALLVKTTQIESFQQPSPQKNLDDSGIRRLAVRDCIQVNDSLRKQYGFDLESILTHQRLSLWHRGNQVLAVPELFYDNFTNLPFYSLGMLIGEKSGSLFIPSHEFTARFIAMFTNGRIVLPDDDLPAWLAGLDIKPAPTSLPNPRALVVVFDRQNRFLGRGKVLPDRLKNLLPRHLF
jgi:16S rRNA (cytosine1407-C5)-methyltransferase